MIEGKVLCDGILGNSSILFVKHFFQKRKDLIDKDSIRGVVTTRYSGISSVQVALIILGKENHATWFADCNSIADVVSLLLGNITEDIEVHYSEIITADNLLPNYYSAESQKVSETLQNTTTMDLEELAEIIP